MTFEYHRASIGHFLCTNVLVYARACVAARVRYRWAKSSYVQNSNMNNMYIYTYKCMFFATANKRR